MVTYLAGLKMGKKKIKKLGYFIYLQNGANTSPWTKLQQLASLFKLGEPRLNYCSKHLEHFIKIISRKQNAQVLGSVFRTCFSQTCNREFTWILKVHSEISTLRRLSSVIILIFSACNYGQSSVFKACLTFYCQSKDIRNKVFMKYLDPQKYVGQKTKFILLHLQRATKHFFFFGHNIFL